MVATSLHVERPEIECDGMGHLEQLLRQLRVHHLAGPVLLGRHRKQAPHDGIHAALLDQPPGREEGLTEREVALGDHGKVGAQAT